MDESRKAFEEWCKTVMTDDADFCMEWGDYSNLNVRLRWEAWKASRATIDIEVPGWDMFDTTKQIVGAIEDELRAAGIKVKE